MSDPIPGMEKYANATPSGGVEGRLSTLQKAKLPDEEKLMFPQKSDPESKTTPSGGTEANPSRLGRIKIEEDLKRKDRIESLRAEIQKAGELNEQMKEKIAEAGFDLEDLKVNPK